MFINFFSDNRQVTGDTGVWYSTRHENFLLGIRCLVGFSLVCRITVGRGFIGPVCANLYLADQSGSFVTDVMGGTDQFQPLV